MEDFPSNSQRPEKKAAPKKATEPKKVEKVVTGEVVTRKKPLGRQFKDTFVPGDVKGAAGHVFLSVLVPAAKDMIVESAQEYIQRMIYGEDSGPRRRASQRSNGLFGRIDYNGISSGAKKVYQKEDPRSAGPSRRARAMHNFDEIILATRVEAEEVIDRLFDIVSQYEVATVRDLYDLVGETAQWTDEKWGWTDIRGAAVTRVRNGYLLDLPRPEPID